MNINLAKTIPLADTNAFTMLKASGKFAAKNGFTLAEVLITLTIIGVVAAMTIPTLLSNYQKQTYVTGLKKGYSVLSQAAKMVPIETGCEIGSSEKCDFTGIPNNWTNDIFLLSKTLKTIKYDTIENLYDGKVKNADYFDLLQKDQIGIVTADGMFFSMCSNGYCLDINGAKRPNKLGRDIFVFDIAYNEAVIEGKTPPNIETGRILPYGSRAHADLRNYLYSGYKYWNQDGIKRCTAADAEGKNYQAQWNAYYYCTGRVLEEGKMNY